MIDCEHIFDSEFFSEEQVFDSDFQQDVVSFEADFDSSIAPVGKIEIFMGDYEVTPKFEKQKLETRNKLMEKEVTVLEIPVTRVSNTSGGKTIIIGG